MKMGRAAVWHGRFDIKVESLPLPEVKKDSVLIKVEAASVCGTDGHLIQEDPPYPAILCHEVVGRIVEMGEESGESLNVYGGSLREGDRIVIYPWVTCGRCEGCLHHRSGTCTTCENSFVYGIPYSKLGLEGKERISSSVQIAPYFKGGFAEYLYVFPNTYVWKIPDGMPSKVAALLDPMAVAVRGIELAQTCPGILEESFNTNAQVVVIGSGPVGTLTALAAKIMGVEQVIIVGGRKKRLEIGQKVAGTDRVIGNEFEEADKVAKVKEMTRGGADVVFQCANSSNAFAQGLEMLRRLGSLIEIGNMVNTGHEIRFDPARLICNKHARIVGMSANHPGAFDKAFHLLQRYNQYPFEHLFTHTCGLERIGETLQKMHNADYMKGLVLPGGGSR